MGTDPKDIDNSAEKLDEVSDAEQKQGVVDQQTVTSAKSDDKDGGKD